MTMEDSDQITGEAEIVEGLPTIRELLGSVNTAASGGGIVERKPPHWNQSACDNSQMRRNPGDRVGSSRFGGTAQVR